ncbi:uncharacterized protein LOC129602221 [Paramacrobiotus metropolitanus]|uniref:uncharacterized protein LOC129602221 n=1 Tax=Paramacrobiotus metropolitanus TaxID=2943436 RepID=UPI002445C1A7|nr:uncharacterized protein LOC129602221 [Paramacrobiotus metropolitanus]
MTSEEFANGPAKSGLLSAEESDQLFQFWFTKTPLPEKFVNRIRVGSQIEVTVSRFGKTISSSCWTYMARFPDVIMFSVTPDQHPCSADLSMATINLVAVGAFVQSPFPAGVQCDVAIKIYDYEAANTSGRSKNQRKKLESVRHSGTILRKKNLTVAKLQLGTGFPVAFGKRYVLSLQTWHAVVPMGKQL